MILSAIVAATDNDVISSEGKIPWHMPADFARLKEVTMGHPLIMGRKTHDSIGRTLPGRTNIVISRNPDYRVSDGSILVDSLDAALKRHEVTKAKEAFIFGGETVYEQAMPLTQRIYLTRVHTTLKGDTYFKFDKRQWKEVKKESYKADAHNPYDWDWYLLERA